MNEPEVVPPSKQERKIPSFGLPHLLAFLLVVSLAFAWQMSKKTPEPRMADTLNLEIALGEDNLNTRLQTPENPKQNNTLENVTASGTDNSSDRQPVTGVLKKTKEELPRISKPSTKEVENDTVELAGMETLEKTGLFLKVKPWGDIYINGTMRETSPLFSPLQLTAGRYELEVRNPQYASFRSNITLLEGKIDTMEVILQSAEGFLELQVVPWAQIYINEKYLETTPLDEPLTLPVGTHTLRLLNPTYRSWEGEIEIHPDKTTQKKVSLTHE